MFNSRWNGPSLEPKDDAMSEFINATEYGAKFDSQFNDVVEEVFAASEVMLKGPIRVLTELQRMFSDDLGKWPIPNSEGKLGSNELTDKYERRVVGKEKPIKGSWYKDLYLSTPIGKAQEEAIKSLQAVRADKMDDVAKEHVDYKRMTKVELSQEEGRLRARMSKGTNLIKRAMQVQFQIFLISEELPKVGVKFAIDVSSGELMATTVPVVTFNIEAPEQAKAVSVGTFIGYDVMAAKAANGTAQDLWETASGSAKDSADGEDEHDFAVTVATFDSLMAAITNFFEAGKGVNAVTLKNAMRKWDKHSILSFGDAVAELNNIYTSDEFQKMYVPLATGQQEQAA